MPAQTRQEPIVRIARALGDPARLGILRVIFARAEVSCQELTQIVSLAQATVSHHLKVLTDVGLVSARVEGPFHFYRGHRDVLRTHGRALLASVTGGPPGKKKLARKMIHPRTAERLAPPRRP